MDALRRFRDWWLGQFRKTGRLGKVVWVGAPLLFACCFCWTALLIVVPSPDVEPTAAVALRAGSTVDAVDGVATGESVATQELVAATAALIEGPTETAAPSRTVAPTRTPAPTSTEEPATARPSATMRPTSTARPRATATTAPSATAVPATATRPPATATSAPLPTAAPTLVPVTAVPPTAVPATVAPTSPPPPPPPPTEPPAPTAPPPASSSDVIISSVRYDGDVPQVESDEYAVITNTGGGVINLGGWRLNAGEPDQNFSFPSFDLQPQQSCRVYTNEFHPESCGFTFGRGDAIWRNSGDCGTLHDATGAEVSRYCW